jgi:hypothetical protein
VTAEAILLAVCVLTVATRLPAQTAPAAQKQAKPQTPEQSNSNPFPEDTNSIPVLTSTPEAAGFGDDVTADLNLPAGDADPVRSPDGAGADDSDQGFSSSSAGLDSILPTPGSGDEDKTGRHKKHGRPEPPPHQETAAEDLTVAKYYMDNKNWKAALSRYQSAMVLSPEEPEVYWGLAESQRHLGDMASAKANYLKVVEYDPDSKHGKEAAKALKSPEIAKADATAAK